MSVQLSIRPMCWTAAAWLGSVLGTIAQAETIDPVKSAQVKAAYLYNFAKFSTWPDDAFTDESASVVIGILGDNSFGETLEKTVKDKTVADRKFVVKRWPSDTKDDPAALRRCHILYVSESRKADWASILSLVGDAPVLVVGEGEAFAAAGGMVSFVLAEGNIVFHINRDAVDRTKLKLSSKLMKLAKVVYHKGTD